MPGFLKNLFSGKPEKESEAELRKKQEAAWEEKTELTDTAESCYRRGKEYQRKGDLERARLYLERASTLYSSFEQVFDEAEVLMEDCDEQIGALEEEDLLYNELLEAVTERTEELENGQNYLWGLLSLSRLQAVFKRLSACPECEILGEFERVLDIFSQGLVRELHEEERQYLQDFITRLYDFGDSEAFADTSNQVATEDGKALQVFDLNGNSLFTCIHIFLDNCIYAFCDGFENIENAEPPEMDFIPGILLLDYYLRTEEGDVRRLPPIQKEMDRIWSDCEFLEGEPKIQEVAERMDAYRKMDMLKNRS